MVLGNNTWSGDGLQDEDYRKLFRDLDMYHRVDGIKGYHICLSTSALQE